MSNKKRIFLVVLIAAVVFGIYRCNHYFKYRAKVVSMDITASLPLDVYGDRPEEFIVTLYLPIFTYDGKVPYDIIERIEKEEKEKLSKLSWPVGWATQKMELGIVDTKYGPMLKYQSNNYPFGIHIGFAPEKPFDVSKIGMCPFLGVVEKKTDSGEKIEMAESMIFADYKGDYLYIKSNVVFGSTDKLPKWLWFLYLGSHGPQFDVKDQYGIDSFKVKKGWQKVAVFVGDYIIRNKCEVDKQ